MNNIRIDLHTHTSSSILNGDRRITFDSVQKSLSIFDKFNVKIAAFSDHNRFNSEQYILARELAKKYNILFLPAIEVNVQRTSDSKVANIIYIFSDLLNNEQLKEIELIAKKFIPKSGISNKNVDIIFQKFETIKIPHIGKSDAFKYEDIKDFDIDAIEISSYNNLNFKSTIKKGYKGSIVAFSDTHVWEKYPECSTLKTEIDEMEQISFKELKKALAKNKDYTKLR